jgi:hypothetical protein
MTPYKEDDFVWIKRHTVNYLFKFDINFLWDFIKDTKKTYVAEKELRTIAVFTKGHESYEVNSEFYFRCVMNNVDLFFKVKDVKETPEYKRIYYNVYCKERTLNYDYALHLYKVTLQNWTLLNWEVIFEGKNGIQMNKSLFFKMEIDKKLILKKINQYLYYSIPKEKNNFTQFESIIIDFPAEDIFKIISDWKVFQRIVPKICDQVEYSQDTSGIEDNPKAIGTRIILKWFKKKKSICELKVIKSEYDQSKKEYQYSLTSVYGDPKIPDQKINFRIFECENFTYIQFWHFYKEPLSCFAEEKISKYKRHILKNLKRRLDALSIKKKEYDLSSSSIEISF